MIIRPTDWKISDVTDEELWVIYKSVQYLHTHIKEKKGTWGKEFTKKLTEMRKYLKEYKYEW